MSGQRCLLAAAGRWPNQAVWGPLVDSSQCIVAVDGGMSELTSNGIKANVIIGDMDSIDYSTIDEQNDAEIIEVPSQNESDLVKAFNWCSENGYNAVDVVGVSGGRTDHIIATFAALNEAPKDLEIKLFLEDCVAFLVNNNTVVETGVGQHVSVFALNGKIKDLKMSGFEYDLEGIELQLSTRGLHNIAASINPTISFDKESTGVLLVMLFY